MFWSNKENKKKLPDLPPFKPTGTQNSTTSSKLETHEDSEVSNALPSFPDSPSSNKFSQAAIKEAVGSSEEENTKSTTKIIPVKDAKKSSVIEMDDWSPENPPEKEFSETDIYPTPKPNYFSSAKIEPYSPNSTVVAPPPNSDPSERLKESLYPQNIQRQYTIKKGTDVFIKIEKYNNIRRLIDEAENKLSEIDQTIKNIRETRLKEEQEISAWEKDIMDARTKIQEVSDTIFQKID